MAIALFHGPFHREIAVIAPLADDAPRRADLVEIVASDPLIAATLIRARDLALPDWLVVSGAVYQTVWNRLTGRPSGHGLKDIDLVWFDPDDLSFEAEDRTIARVAAIFADWPVPVEARNQARVHLWFERRFGAPYAPLSSSAEALGRYASICHAVGLRMKADGRIDVYAPFGLDDVFALRIRPNRVLDNAATHAAKAARMAALWPELTVEPW